MSDIKATPEPQEAASENVDGWVQAICRVAGHYRLSYSPGSVKSVARWQRGRALPTVLKNMARHAGLSVRMLDGGVTAISGWRLPLVIQLNDGQVLSLIHISEPTRLSLVSRMPSSA